MPSQVLVISKRKEDIAFAQAIASNLGAQFNKALNKDETRRLLVTFPASLVFWDGESEFQYDGVMESIPKYARPQRVFAITDKNLYVYPHLYKSPVYGHYLHRRYQGAAIDIYTRLAQLALENDMPFGVARYLPAESAVRQIILKRSSQKSAAVDAIQGALTKQGVQGRLAALVAQAADELVLNALYDAPSVGGKRVRYKESRNADFELTENDQVTVEFGQCSGYLAVGVGDKFGTLLRRNMLDSLRKHLEKEGADSTKVKVEESGLGLHGIVRSGVSLVYVNKPRDRTQMILIFPRVENYKDFRTSFRFLSLFGGQ
jgi:hypothetical protein